MQGVGIAGRKRIKNIVFHSSVLLLCAFLIFLDQWTKVHFKNLYLEKGVTVIIDNFFRLTYTVNTGAAWSFLEGVSWAQTFFKVLTAVALVCFCGLYFIACKKRYKWLQFSVGIIISGTLGNFIDRLLYSGVTDFISFQFGSYFFPVFNIADICLTVGIIMLLVHFLFIDENAIFKRVKKDENIDAES